MPTPTSNRTALIVGNLAAFGAFLTALLGAFEDDIIQGVVASVSILVGGALCWKFLDGSQNWDSLMVAGVPRTPGVSAPEQGNANTDAVSYSEGSDPTAVEDLSLMAEGMEMYEQTPPSPSVDPTSRTTGVYDQTQERP